MRSNKAIKDNLSFKQIKKYIIENNGDSDIMCLQTPEGTNARLIFCINFFEKLIKDIGNRNEFKSIGFNLLKNTNK